MNTERLKRILSDLTSASIAWVLFFYYRKTKIENYNFEISENLIYGVIGVSLFWLIIYLLSGNYEDVKRVSRINELYRTFIQTIIGCLLIFFFLIIDDIENYKNYTFYYQAIFVLTSFHFLITFFTRFIITSSMVRKIQSNQIAFNTILIGDEKSIAETYQLLNSLSRSTGNKVIGYINSEDNQEINNSELENLGNIQQLEKIIKKNKIEEAIISCNKKNTKNLTEIINTLIYHNIITKVTPSMVDVLAGKVKMQSLFNVSLIEIQQIKMTIFQSFIKRTIDIVFSMCALIILCPFLIIISIIIKYGSSGPIFYYQKRLGLNRKTFNIIKFRSMYVNAEKDKPLLSSKGDTRITSWGKIMRKYRLDELPQFYNVLIGEMSIIGPRPEREFFAKKILLKAPHYKLIYKLKPGITSWGMVKFGYAENIDEMISRLRYDIIYLENLSIVLQGRGK
jgi:exopolysaccharide biosynthesis polyprenyl glycosylphosphotransferase